MQGRQRLIRSLLGQNKFLSGRQANDPRDRQSLLGKVIARNDELLLAGLKFDLRAQGVDRRSQPGFQLVGGFLIKRLCALDLSFGGFNPGTGSDRLQIGVAHRQHHHLARILVAELRSL